MTTETLDAHTPSPHETEERLRLARRVTNEGFWDWDLGSQTVYFDPRYYLMAGYAVDEFPHRLEEFQQRVHPDDQAEVMAIVQEFLKGQACRCEAEFRFRKKAGDYLWIHSKWLIAERDDQGKPSRLVGTHANITERKLAEKALRASEELLSETAHIAQVGGWEIDLDGNILAWTEETFCIHQLESGLPPSIDQAIAFYHPDDQPRVRAVVQRAIESGEAFDFEARLFTAKKNLRWVRAIARVRYQEGRPSGIFGTVQDITERKRSEEALQQREALFRAVVENTNDGILLIEKDRRIAYVSPSHKRVSGYSPEDAQESEALSYVHPDDQAHAAEALSQISQHPGQGISLEYRLRHKLGHWIWIEATVTNLLDDPYVNAFVVNSRDITDRKRAEQELRTTERRLRNEKDFVEKLFDVTDDTIFVFEPATGKPVRWNNACRKITGYSDEEIASLKFPDAYYSQEELALADEAIQKVYSDGTGTVELTLLTKDGKAIPFEYSGSLIPTREGEPRILISIGRDITERKQAELERETALGQLKKTLEGSITAIARTIETRDPYTAGHQERVAQLAQAIAMELGLNEAQIEGLGFGGLIHDIGKISVPAELLSTPRRLRPQEMELIRGHAQVGYDIIKDIDFPWPVKDMILQHHERLDGSGYPQGLKEPEILYEAKILAVADVVEAMSSHRPYRPGFGIEVALEHIRECRGNIYDAKAVDACLTLFRDKEFAFKIPF